MSHTILDADIIPFFFQAVNTVPEPIFIFLQNRWGHCIKPMLHQFLLGFITQNLKRRFVDADNLGTIYRMAYHSTVHGGKDHLQNMVLLSDLSLIRPLLRDIIRHPDRPHHTAVIIIQRGFIGSQDPHAVPCLNHLLWHEGLAAPHNFILGFYTDGIVLLHIPNIGMSLPLYLFLWLIHRPTEAVIYLFMYPILILIPDQVRDIVNGGLQILAGLPEIRAHLKVLLPSQKTELYLLFWCRHHPDIRNFRHTVQKGCHLFSLRQHNKLCFLFLLPDQLFYRFPRIQILQSHKNYICPGSQRFLRGSTLRESVCKMLQRRHFFNQFKNVPLITC